MGTHMTPLPLGSPMELTDGLVGVAGRTDARKLAGDCGVEVNGEDLSEYVGLHETGGGGGGGGGGKSCAGEDTLLPPALPLRNGGGGGGKDGELGDSTLPDLARPGAGGW